MRGALSLCLLLTFACHSPSQTASSDGGSQQPGGATANGDLANAPIDFAGVDLAGRDLAGGSPAPATSGISITVEPDGSGIAQNLLTAMQDAKQSVHVEMYLLTNAKYIMALSTLKSANIDVKVVLNQTFPPGTAAADTNATSYATLMNDTVPVHWSPTTTGFDGYTHAKMVVIDAGTANAQVWIMTMNLDTAAPKYNREYLALDTNAADVNEAESIFEADYDVTKITPSGSLIVAPQPPNNAQKALLDLINGATTSIDVECEELDAAGLEADIATALGNKAAAGVPVHMVLEDSTDAAQTSAVSALQSKGGKVVGYVYSSTALDIHAKAIVVDGNKAFVGSENLSGGSLGYNREVGVIFTEASEVQKVYSTIEADFAGGSPYASK